MRETSAFSQFVGAGGVSNADIRHYQDVRRARDHRSVAAFETKPGQPVTGGEQQTAELRSFPQVRLAAVQGGRGPG